MASNIVNCNSKDVRKRQKEDVNIVEATFAEEVETTKRWRWEWQMFMAVFALHIAYYSPFLVTFYHGKLHYKYIFWWDLAIATVGVIDLVVQWFTSRTEWFLYVCNIFGYVPWIFICELFVVMFPAWEWIRWLKVLITFRAFFIVKVYCFLNTVKERMNRHYNRSIAIITLKFVVLTFFWAHLIACTFFVVARIWHEPRETWLGNLTIKRKKYYDFKNEPEWNNYVICVYYSMTKTISVGYGRIHPGNILEIIVAKIVLLMNLVVMTWIGSHFISPLLTRVIQKEKSELELASRRKQD